MQEYWIHVPAGKTDSNVEEFLRRVNLEQGAGRVQCLRHSPPTKVARVRFPDSTPYVGWVWCWLSSLFRKVFLRVFRVSPLLKFRFDLDTVVVKSNYMDVDCDFFFILINKRKIHFTWVTQTYSEKNLSSVSNEKSNLWPSVYKFRH